jgi:hypothetical protein
MARRSVRRRTRRTTRRPTTRRRVRRSSLESNPKRRTTRLARGGHRRRVQRRRNNYRRNPSLMGMQLPGLNTFIFAGVGFASAPLIEGFFSRFMPAQITQNIVGRYVVKIASIAGAAWATKQFIGRTEARSVLIGGGVYLFTSAMRDFAPGIIPGLGAYVPTNQGVRAYSPVNRSALGAYTNVGSYPGAGIPVLPMRGNSSSATRFSRFG